MVVVSVQKRIMQLYRKHLSLYRIIMQKIPINISFSSFKNIQKDNKTVQNSIARKIWIKLDTFKKIMMYARRLFKLAPIRSKHAVHGH